MPRFFVDLPLAPELETELPASAARHVQVLRLQPGATLTLFDGRGTEWPAELLHVGRRDVRVRVGSPQPVDREPAIGVTLALGMPANERMDALVEKATELGVAAIQPLMCERSVLRLSGERAERRQAHWQAVATSAAEQCGRAVLPQVHAPMDCGAWLRALAPSADDEARWLLSLAPDARPLPRLAPLGVQLHQALLLSGPEGGLTPAEEQAARAAGLSPAGLGPRILRADTAPLAALSWLVLAASVRPA